MTSYFRIEPLEKADDKNAREISLLMRQHVPNLPEISADYFNKAIYNKQAKIFIALNNKNTIIGIITMFSYHKVDGVYKTCIEDLVVNSDDRRKGIGEALVKKVLQTAKEMKINTVHLTSHAIRTAANSLYRKIGFKFYDTNYYKYDL